MHYAIILPGKFRTDFPGDEKPSSLLKRFGSNKLLDTRVSIRGHSLYVNTWDYFIHPSHKPHNTYVTVQIAELSPIHFKYLCKQAKEVNLKPMILDSSFLPYHLMPAYPHGLIYFGCEEPKLEHYTIWTDSVSREMYLLKNPEIALKNDTKSIIKFYDENKNSVEDDKEAIAILSEN